MKETYKEYVYSCGGIKSCEYSDCCKFVEDAIGYKETFKWHDLIKDSDDLPPQAENVEVVLHDGTHCFMFVEYCIEEYGLKWYSSYPYEGDEQPLYTVRYWRRIEEPKGDE